jgi:hypothetical protein
LFHHELFFRLWPWIQFCFTNYQHNSSYKPIKPCACTSHYIYSMILHQQIALSYAKEASSGSIQPNGYSHFTLLPTCLLLTMSELRLL